MYQNVNCSRRAIASSHKTYCFVASSLSSRRHRYLSSLLKRDSRTRELKQARLQIFVSLEDCKTFTYFKRLSALERIRQISTFH